MTLLAVDQGNTRTKFGFFVDGGLQRQWTIPTDKSMRVEALLTAIQRQISSVARIGLSSVVPEMLPRWQAAARVLEAELVVVTGNTPTPLINAYETPSSLGPDRLMVAVAAAHFAGTPVIPISIGTATVVDAVSADGRYLGGIIAPGIDVTNAALLTSTSALIPISWGAPRSAIGRDSKQAQINGLFYQTIGGLQAMIAAVRAELHADAPIVLTGGGAGRVSPYLGPLAHEDEFLVLHGIALTLGT